jgi:hypothetical protein
MYSTVVQGGGTHTHTHTHTVIPVKIERGFLAVTERGGGVVVGAGGERSDVVSTGGQRISGINSRWYDRNGLLAL